MKYISFFIIVFCFNLSFAQNKEYNFVILVDGEVVKYTYGMIKIVDSNNIKNIIKCNLIAGDLSIKESDYEKLLIQNINNVTFEFGYSKSCGTNIKYYNYSIDDFKVNWLNEGFFILYIYNTDNKKYKKIYNSLEGKNYTYEYDSSIGSMRRVQKKKTKEQKECECKE